MAMVTVHICGKEVLAIVNLLISGFSFFFSCEGKECSHIVSGQDIRGARHWYPWLIIN